MDFGDHIVINLVLGFRRKRREKRIDSYRTENVADGKSTSSVCYDQDQEPWHSTPEMNKTMNDIARPPPRLKSQLTRLVHTCIIEELILKVCQCVDILILVHFMHVIYMCIFHQIIMIFLFILLNVTATSTSSGYSNSQNPIIMEVH